MLTDRRTWTTMFYFLLMLPLGILYFTTAITGIAVSLGLTVGSIASLLLDTGFGHISIDNAVYFGPSPALAPLLFIAGILLLTAVMHLVRGIGRAHGTLAKHLLVAPSGAA
jgi:hypothetical protein